MRWLEPEPRQSLLSSIPVIDLFAGPGGLGEGFSAFRSPDSSGRFGLALSIEKDRFAHSTLELRAFFRQFESNKVPTEYYQYLRGEISRNELFRKFPPQSRAACRLAWRAELGHEDLNPRTVDLRIRSALGNAYRWILIGGPPCQAYSYAGRSRMRGADPEAFERDSRHFLYREYLRVLAVHKPPVFVMENVKGLLTCRLNGENIFRRIIMDLQEPGKALNQYPQFIQRVRKGLRYQIFPLTNNSDILFTSNDVAEYVVQAEKFGVPQARHRVILLGIRSDLGLAPRQIREKESTISTWDVIGDLPPLRSGLSAGKDSGDLWADAVKSAVRSGWLHDQMISDALRHEILSTCSRIPSSLETGGQFTSSREKPKYLPDWYHDEQLGGICNHSSRLHMPSDLHRYLFASCFAKVYRRSPHLRDFPAELLPKHRNVEDALKSNWGTFTDRFRVQLPDSPATTVTCHMSKDGHYFIHPDPTQCRSLTVREAARLQTFPDNYFFEGSRTSQYEQVGNAVPPILALSIAETVFDLIEQCEMKRVLSR
jgi:DNA (cytosine-5)-methyltransferase 1